MAKIKVDIPESLLDEEAKKKIKSLERKVKSLEKKVRDLERELADGRELVAACKRYERSYENSHTHLI